ncbi:hypothetical protein D3C78_1307120 [compost metagenome]
MDGFAFGAGRLGHPAHLGGNIFFDIQLCQSDRQPNAVTQRGNRFDLFYRRVFQYQLGERAERDFFAVIKMVCIRNRCQAVVNRVGGGQSATFKAHTAEVGIGFNDALKGWRDDMLFRCQHRLFSLFDQGVVAEFRQRESRLRAFPPGHGGGSAA